MSIAPSNEERPRRADFETLGTLGEGSVGVVTKVRHRISGNVYALKAISKHKVLQQDLEKQLLAEVRTQMTISHPSLLRCFSYFEEDDTVFLVLEFAEGGDLHRLLRRRGSLNESDAARIFEQVSQGMRHLHSCGIIHRDLKPENILMCGGDMDVKICDFGWCGQEADNRTTFCGTLCTLAPEMVEGKPYDTSVDIWALGVVLFEMLTGLSPFDRGTGLLQTCQNIRRGLDAELLEKLPQGARSLVQGLLAVDPKQRTPLADALAHPWVEAGKVARKKKLDWDETTPAEENRPTVASVSTASSERHLLLSAHTSQNADSSPLAKKVEVAGDAAFWIQADLRHVVLPIAATPGRERLRGLDVMDSARCWSLSSSSSAYLSSQLSPQADATPPQRTRTLTSLTDHLHEVDLDDDISPVARRSRGQTTTALGFSNSTADEAPISPLSDNSDVLGVPGPTRRRESEVPVIYREKRQGPAAKALSMRRSPHGSFGSSVASSQGPYSSTASVRLDSPAPAAAEIGFAAAADAADARLRSPECSAGERSGLEQHPHEEEDDDWLGRTLKSYGIQRLGRGDATRSPATPQEAGGR